MRRSMTQDQPRVAPRAGVTGAPVEPIVATHSFEAPRAGLRRIRVPGFEPDAREAKDAPTRRGGPRPITETSVRAITGDYAKADDNETAHRATARRITERLPTFDFGPGAESPAAAPYSLVRERAPAAAPEAQPAIVNVEVVAPPATVAASTRGAWLQGALTGALVLTVAWLASLIARAG